MVSQQIIDIIIKASDQASATAEKVDNNLKKIGDTSSRLSRIPGFDTMRTKLSSVAQTIDGKLGGALTKARTKFNSFKSTVSNVSTNIKSKLGGALDGVRAKLSSVSNGAKGLSSSFGFLKGALSMTVGMIGFDLVNGLVQAGRAAINASSQLDYFGNRLQNVTGKSKMSSAQFQKFKTDLDGLQKEFRKVDMTSVGATAEEIALKMNLPSEKLGDLTRMTAVLSSTFVKEGRTQEDAVLAVGDALDGQFKRLQEIGITQDELKKNGWSGELSDQAGLIDALNKTMKDMGYEQTAKDITNLDEAWTALTIAGGQLLQKVLVPITPVLIQIIEAIIRVTDVVGPMISGFLNAVANMPDWAIIALAITAFGVAVNVVSTWISTVLVGALADAAMAALDLAMAMYANPLTWIVLALIAVTVAVYEVGKAMGWWTDIWGMLDAAWNNVLVPLYEFLSGVFTQAWNAVSAAINAILPYITNITNAFSRFMNGQMSLPGLIMTIMTNVFNVYRTIFSMVINALVAFGKQMLAKGVSAAHSFVNGIIARIKQLPGKVYSGLMTVVGRIRTAIQAWISAAVSKVQSLISKITSPFSGVAGKISSALSGVASALTAPFKAAWSAIEPLYNKIKGALDFIHNNGAGYDYLEGQNPDGSWGSNAAGYELTPANNVQTLKGEFTFIHDLRNLPNGVTAKEVASIVEKSTTNDDFIKKLVGSNVFQKYDLKMKSSIQGKNNRARGV